MQKQAKIAKKKTVKKVPELQIEFTSDFAKEVYAKREKPFNWAKGDSGIDLSFVSDEYKEEVLLPGEFKMIPTGVKCHLVNVRGDEFEIQIRGRSGLSAKGIMPSFGTIDFSYAGELKVVLFNFSSEPFYYKTGDRIAQIVIHKIEQPEIELVEELDETDRGEGGFGSTGV